MDRKHGSKRVTALGAASRETKGNGGHMIEVAGLWQRTGLDRA